MKKHTYWKTVVKKVVVFRGSEVRKARLELGMSQRALADAVGVTGTHICDIEKDRRAPSPDIAAKLIAILEKGSFNEE